ncbi:hypothetical protein ATE49_19435 [Elizabethkingia miricola]|uniref:Uncharacterized protein n=1 Tax=Elizabethkingia miricola TaxID=172045 RepID=A0ABY3NGQ3_ELIMR|nr:hypothetical protein [Elizabethkingia miricola]OBS14811.1 hypothetical protein ATE49_19435 [Elizabethkingia miricola]TYO92015.1 hypothetical protein LX74_01672 [Elizabethkingia miricola]
MKLEDELKSFEAKVRDIYCNVRYDSNGLNQDQKLKEEEKKEILREIIKNFKIGQKKILTELRLLQSLSKVNQTELITARREGDKKKAKVLMEGSKIFEYQKSIYRSLADTIAWQLLNGEHYLYRRLYTGEEGTKDLSDQSFNYVIDFNDQINTDPDSFCLISDITSNIQLGDCLIKDKEGIKISEIKSGEINFRVLDVIEDRNLTDDSFDEKDFSPEFDEKFIKQMKRVVAQKGKNERAVKIVKEHKGPDPKYKDAEVHIVENDFPLGTYHADLVGLLGELKTEDYAYTCIGEIIHIGIYKNEWRTYGQFSMKQLCAPYPFVDLMSSRTLICEPIFLKPFPEEIIMDMVMGRIKVFIGVNYDNFIEFSNGLGVKASWSSAKELQKYLENFKHDRRTIFSFENKGIKLEIDGHEIFVGGGFFSKMIFDHFLPQTMILKYSGLIDGVVNSGKENKNP